MVTVKAVACSAPEGGDFRQPTEKADLRLAASAQVQVPIVNDAVDELTEDFTVKLADAPGAAVAPAKVTILDDDPPLLSVGDGDSVTEGGVLRFPVALS